MHRNQHHHVPPSLPQAPLIPQGGQQVVVASPAPAPVTFPSNLFFAVTPPPAAVLVAPGRVAPQAVFFGSAPNPNLPSIHMHNTHNHAQRGFGHF